MPAYNFRAQFAEDVRSGRKRQTIRALRKDGIAPAPGQRFVGYTGMRTKRCEILCEGVITQVREIDWPGRGIIRVDGSTLDSTSAARLAAADGFVHIFHFLDFFEETHGFPFNGHIINWR